MQLRRIWRAKQKNFTTKITDYWSILSKICNGELDERNEEFQIKKSDKYDTSRSCNPIFGEQCIYLELW